MYLDDTMHETNCTGRLVGRNVVIHTYVHMKIHKHIYVHQRMSFPGTTASGLVLHDDVLPSQVRPCDQCTDVWGLSRYRQCEM